MRKHGFWIGEFFQKLPVKTSKFPRGLPKENQFFCGPHVAVTYLRKHYGLIKHETVSNNCPQKSSKCDSFR